MLDVLADHLPAPLSGDLTQLVQLHRRRLLASGRSSRVGGDPHYVTSSNVNSPTRKCSGTHPATRFTKGSNPAGVIREAFGAPCSRGAPRVGKGMTSAKRVNRGGSWNNDADNARAAIRNENDPSNRNDNLGFRPSSPGNRTALAVGQSERGHGPAQRSRFPTMDPQA